MTKKKHRKGGDNSSEDSSSSSSSSSSKSSDSSKNRKKRSKKTSKESKSAKPQKEEVTESVKVIAKNSRSLSREEARVEVEQSKWDSPDDKSKKDSRKSDKLQKHSEHHPSTYREHFSKPSEASTHERHYSRTENRHSSHLKTQSRDDRRDRRPTEGDDRKDRGSRETRADYRSRRDDNRSEERHRRDDRDTHRKYHSREDTRDNRRGEYNSRSNQYDERHDRYRDNRNDYRNDRSNKNKRRRSRSGSFNHKEAKWGKDEDTKLSKTNQPTKDKEKPNFALSGKLTEETNTFRGIVIKYSEPPEARKPKRRWRLYPFKGDKALQTLYIHRESAYLIGRERKVVDLPVDHPSCSKQHAVLQYRLVPFTRDDGSTGKRVRPYLIDLESANGTFINNKKIEPKRYVELLEKDVIKFGFSSREYVLLHENSKDEADDDDVKDEEVVENVKKEKD